MDLIDPRPYLLPIIAARAVRVERQLLLLGFA